MFLKTESSKTSLLLVSFTSNFRRLSIPSRLQWSFLLNSQNSSLPLLITINWLFFSPPVAFSFNCFFWSIIGYPLYLAPPIPVLWLSVAGATIAWIFFPPSLVLSSKLSQLVPSLILLSSSRALPPFLLAIQ